MAIPLHVKIVSGAASAALFLIGLCQLLTPAQPHWFLPPAENSFMAFIWSTADSSDLGPGQRVHSMVQGMQVMTLAATKLCILFTNAAEGTFLRRNVFLTMGAGQLLGALVLVFGEPQTLAQAAGFSFWQHGIILGSEGAVLLHDALMRERKVKGKTA